MYDIEVNIRNKASIRDLLYHKEKLEVHEGETSYKEKVIHLNLTGIWDLALGDYDAFLDELVGMILHEYLHYFFHVNGLPQNEEMIDRLSIDLQILSLGRLIGATENTEENVRQYKKCIDFRFGGKIDP
jgi:hypothetical protein